MKTLSRCHSRGRRPARLILALTMTAVLSAGLAACSSSGVGDSSSGDDVASLEADREQQESGGESSGSGGSLGEPDSDGSGDGATDEAGDRSGKTPALRAPASDRAVISKASISLVSDDVAQARRDVQRIVDAQNGWITEEDTDTDEKGVAFYSRLVVRVPAPSFAVTMASLEKAAELRSSRLTSEDVTAQVIDTDVRVRAQQGSLRRVEQLLAEADSLKDIIWIESQLTQRQAELDSLKSQQAWLSDQTSDSTITIDIERTYVPEDEKEESDDEAGFLTGLKAGMKALDGFASALATIVGALLPFALVLAVLGGPVWWLLRRTRRRQAPKQPATT